MPTSTSRATQAKQVPPSPPNLALRHPRCKPSKASSTALPPYLPWAASVQREPTVIATPPSSPWAASSQREPTHQWPDPDAIRATRSERRDLSDAIRATQSEQREPSKASQAKQAKQSKPSKASRAKQDERSKPSKASQAKQAPLPPPPLCPVLQARSVSQRISSLTLTRAEQSKPSNASRE